MITKKLIVGTWASKLPRAVRRSILDMDTNRPSRVFRVVHPLVMPTAGSLVVRLPTFQSVFQFLIQVEAARKVPVAVERGR